MIPGESIRLRPIERGDIPRFVAWFADPEFRSNLASYQPFSLAQEERWFETSITLGDTQPYFYRCADNG